MIRNIHNINDKYSTVINSNDPKNIYILLRICCVIVIDYLIKLKLEYKVNFNSNYGQKRLNGLNNKNEYHFTNMKSVKTLH